MKCVTTSLLLFLCLALIGPRQILAFKPLKLRLRAGMEVFDRKGKIGVVIIDHGSKRDEANQKLIQVRFHFLSVIC